MKLFIGLFLFLSVGIAVAKPITIAHRGASGYLPEHTIEGVTMAHGWGVDYIEPDLVMTKDNALIVMHDIHLDTTTNVAQVFPKRKREDGKYYAIDFTLAEINRLRVNERIDLKTGKAVFPKRFPVGKGDFRIPTFEMFIETIQGLNQSTGRNVGIYPEMKAPGFHLENDKDITLKTLKVLQKYGYDQPDGKIFLQCFEAAPLKRLRTELKVKIPLIQLIGENSWEMNETEDYTKMQTPAGLKAIKSYADGLGVWTQQVATLDKKAGLKSTGLVELAQKIGLPVHVYTLRKEQLPKGVENLQEMADRLTKLGVAGWFTDFGDSIK
jgi:glycerophosphoryl diester phosphodiesterase